jgi:RNA polymerase sigma-70 factor, ECF subfamily
LLALMLINDSRREARFEGEEIVLLAEQDRSLWDRDRISEGKAAIDRAMALGGRGAYVLQAAIAALHTEDPPDWAQIAALYGELARRTESPVVRLNEAAAIAQAGDPEAALRRIDELELESYHYLHSTRGELLRRLDRTEEAREAYARALDLVHSDAERRFLERRLSELGSG